MCWRRVGDRPGVDMPLARQQILSEIRLERNRRLTASDKEWFRVNETNGDVPAWKDYRQALRDLPSKVDVSQVETPQALDAYRPPWPVAPAF